MYEVKTSDENAVRFYSEDYYEIVFFTYELPKNYKYNITMDCYSIIFEGMNDE